MVEQGILTEEQVATFHHDGYLVIPKLYGVEEMAEILAWTEDMENRPEAPGKYMKYFEESRTEPGKRLLNRLENFAPYHESFDGLFKGPKMLGAVSQLFGEQAVLFKEKINFKLAGADGFKVHQDVQAGWDKFGSLHITALVSIDATTPANGCLEMAGGHHKRGLIGSMWEPMSEDDIAGMELKVLTTAPGDAVFFDSFAPHRSGPNDTNEPRRVLYTTYNRLSEGDFREQYYREKRANFPPDCERDPDKSYAFRV